MNIPILKKERHPDEIRLADYLAGGLNKKSRQDLEDHLGSCDSCLDMISAAHEAVLIFNKKKTPKKRKGSVMKRLNIYMILAVVTFTLSFITPRFFIQLLVATLLLGIKWVADSKSTRMLVMIHEAWKNDGAKGASDILQTLEAAPRNRIFTEKLR